MKTICFANNKGGVAKTITAGTVASLLAKKKKVLFVDCDGQANGTILFGATTQGGTLNDALNDRPCEPCKVRDNLFVVPASPSLVTYELEHAKDKQRETRLKTFLDQFNDKFDYCIVDTPPATGALVFSALFASDFVVIPTTSDMFAVAGMSTILDIIRLVQGNGGKVQLAGIVLTQYDRRRITSACEKVLRANYKGEIFKATIRNASIVRELATERKTLADTTKNVPVAEDFNAFVAELTKRTK